MAQTANSPGRISTRAIPLIFWVSSQGHRSLSTWFFVDLLQPLLYRSLSANVKLVFCENCYTYRCIFDVFMGGGVFNVLLCYHLDLLLPSVFVFFFFLREIWPWKHMCVVSSSTRYLTYKKFIFMQKYAHKRMLIETVFLSPPNGNSLSFYQ